ncbi:MAG: HipA domain-containing protein [Comamonas sp.]
MADPARDDAYQPRDELFLWWLAEPAKPRLVGSLLLVDGRRSVALRYADGWLGAGFALSEDLPLHPGLLLPAERGTAAGAVDDARPDRWGERVIRRFERSVRLSLLEFLLFAGDDRYGALGVSLEADAYVPWSRTPMPALDSLAAMNEAVARVLADQPVDERQRRLLRPGVSLGGARPKSVVEIDGVPWLVKFSEGEDQDTELIEHATLQLAARCGIDANPSRALAVGARHAVAVRRFDRAPGRRHHAQSARVALKAAGEDLGYPQLAQLLRRLAPPRAIAAQQAQLFRRMVFNMMIDNTDDHEKNHALLTGPAGAAGGLLLSPAFDIVPSLQGLGQQAMQVGDHGAETSLDNALSQARAFGLTVDQARAIARELAATIDGWPAHYAAAGVRGPDLEIMAQYLGRGPAAEVRRDARVG